jgi:hypothetical protein
MQTSKKWRSAEPLNKFGNWFVLLINILKSTLPGIWQKTQARDHSLKGYYIELLIHCAF